MLFRRKIELSIAGVFLALFAVSALTARAQKENTPSISKPMNPSAKNNVVVEIGESPDAWSKRFGKQVEVNDKNHGLKFYSLDWTKKNQGQVTVKNGAGEFRLDAVLGVMGTFDDEYPTEGFSDILLTVGISESDTVQHEEARQNFFILLRKIQDAGWVRWINPGHPRLSGEESYRYQIKEGKTNYSLDPNHLPPMDVWMKLEDRSRWRFYLNGVEMAVFFSRDQEKMKNGQPGAYIVSLKMQSKNELERSEFQEEDRKIWANLYPALRKKRSAERTEIEKNLQASNYKIDTKYKNPDE